MRKLPRFPGDDFLRGIPVLIGRLTKRIAEVVPPRRSCCSGRPGRRGGPGVAVLESLPDLREDPSALLADLELTATDLRSRVDPGGRLRAGGAISTPEGRSIAAGHDRGSPADVPVRKAPARGPCLAPPDLSPSPPRRVGHSCSWVGTIEEAQSIVDSQQVDRVLIALSEPAGTLDGILQRSRAEPAVPVNPLLPGMINEDPAVLPYGNLQQPLIQPSRIRELPKAIP